MTGTQTTQFVVADYVVFGCSLFICVAVGVYHGVKVHFGSGPESPSHFLMGGQNMKVIPLTISLVVSILSAVSILGVPAEIYSFGSQYFFNIGSGLGILMTAFVFVPLLHPLRLTSMFEYLERRYNSKAVRMVGSIMEILALLLYGGTALLAPATALEGVTPFSALTLSILLGAMVIFYTGMGGLRAVVWTDVIQAFLMLAGILAVLIQGFIKVGSLSDVLELNREGGRLHFYDFDPRPSTRHTFWGLSLGFGFGGFAFYGASQFAFQRFAATRTLREAKLTMLLNIPAFYLFHILLCLCGLVLYAYYHLQGCDPIKNKAISKSSQLMPHFMLQTLAALPGLSGLFVAALTSAALSTISSVMNSIGTLVWEDLIKFKQPFLSDRIGNLVIRLVVCLSGLIIICLSYLANNFSPHIFQVCFAFLGATGGPQLGMFLLGAFIPWANGKGAIVGCFAGIALTSWITIGSYVTRPPLPLLPPAPVNQCYVEGGMNLMIDAYNGSSPYTFNTTASPSPSDPYEEFTGVKKLYTVSYVWYSAIGAFVCVFVGMVVSLVTGGERTNLMDGEHSLVLPLYDKIKSCLCRTKASKFELEPVAECVANGDLNGVTVPQESAEENLLAKEARGGDKNGMKDGAISDVSVPSDSAQRRLLANGAQGEDGKDLKDDTGAIKETTSV